MFKQPKRYKVSKHQFALNFIRYKNECLLLVLQFSTIIIIVCAAKAKQRLIINHTLSSNYSFQKGCQVKFEL